MNVVFVLLVASHAGFWTPTIEFSTKAKCDAALVVMHNTVAAIDMSWVAGSQRVRGICTRIEK